MKKSIRLFSILLITLLCNTHLLLAQANSKSTQKPNVIIVITDDQGKGDLACEGNQYIKTPNIDKFNADAVRFTNYHVSTTCAPTRGALMSGRHSNRVNVFHTINGRSILFEDEVILPQIFAQNGYTNAMFGKWHLGDNYPYRPEDRGFHEVVRHGGGGLGQGPDYWGNDYFDDTYWHNGKLQKYEGYCTDVFFSEALNFIETNKDKPFFCYISTNAPHSPYNLPKKYFDLYQGAKFKDIDSRALRFYGMITNLDDNFKKLEDKLKALGIADNTILIFTTDNGTAAGRSVYNAGMKGGKGSQYEGGHRVPLYIRWPNGQLTGGKDIDALVAHYDVLPTFVDLLGLDFNPVKKLDGKSLKPLLKNGNVAWENRILYMDTQREQNLIKYKKYTVMDDNWRLIDGTELYDMRTDLGQENNVIATHQEIADRLAVGYETWWKSFVDEGVNERYAYIKVGSPKENPTRISAHDMIIGKYSDAWHQNGAIQGAQAAGKWKIEFVEDGDYTISLRRFPRESNLAINETFPAQKEAIEYDRTSPASIKTDFKEAFLYVANISKTMEIKKDQDEVTFTGKIPAGKYDMEAQLIDEVGRVHPAYYVYIEKK
ncbi:arylsulfatase A-like enzyme [Mariniflexile fucanivorans]|uniref:Arylsulfatase A-like enzyme n=1 Tax=Mariniflexile fucanivorans TaxID=264023 RepID=A0A4R1RJC6_9FLAO|nr:arylsulfatase [Mariniflexile fucanivorans]TCL66244.1 arylsulfatase A-like enzyme [Mariniflexile fucanivorans]